MTALLLRLRQLRLARQPSCKQLQQQDRYTMFK
jgi:hypothetical protein